MNRVFTCLDSDFHTVPDGTLINPFLSPKDITSDLPWNVLEGLSVAAGKINPGVVSEIQVLPFISMVTLLQSGSIKIFMKDAGNSDSPYELELDLNAPGNSDKTAVAVVTPPGAFFQLDNLGGSEPAQVLYLSSPYYVFEPGQSEESVPVYDDTITLGRDWKRLALQNWNPPELRDPKHSCEARQRAIQRLAVQNG